MHTFQTFYFDSKNSSFHYRFVLFRVLFLCFDDFYSQLQPRLNCSVFSQTFSPSSHVFAFILALKLQMRFRILLFSCFMCLSNRFKYIINWLQSRSLNISWMQFIAMPSIMLRTVNTRRRKIQDNTYSIYFACWIIFFVLLSMKRNNIIAFDE